MAELKLVIFDLDGTLIDSISMIVTQMRRSFVDCGLEPPQPKEVREIVGISLTEIFPRLRSGLPPSSYEALIAAYRSNFIAARAAHAVTESEPLFDGALDAISRLRGHDHLLLGIATGKARRGVDHILAGHGLTGWFQTIQTADHHPSKPHPSMIEACLSETGVAAKDALIIGDTTYDLEMGRAAGIATIGVGWGNHPPERLRPHADTVLDAFADLDAALGLILGDFA